MLKNRVKLVYGIGGLGKNMMFAMSTIMSIYLTDYVGVSPMFVGGLVLVVRAWDAINDLIMGNIVDNTKSKWGKFRPWILTGAILNAITLLFLYYKPDLPVNSMNMLIYITVFYTLWGMTYTLLDIPFWALIPALSKDQKERENLSVIARIFSNIGLFIIASPYVIIVKYLGGGESDAQKLSGFFLLACIVAGVFIVTQLLIVIFVRENKHETKNKITLKKTVEILLKNDQLQVIVVAVVVFNLVLYISSGMVHYFFKYDVGDENLVTPFVASGGVSMVIASILYPNLSRFLNRKRMFQLSIILPILGCLGLFIVSFFLKNSFISLVATSSLVFFGIGLSMITLTILLSNVVEYGEWKFGERTEGVVFSVQTFIVKLSSAISSGLIGVGLSVIGYKKDAVLGATTLVGMRIMMFLLPIIGLIFALTIFNKHFKLDENAYDNIVSDLEKRSERAGDLL
ncbi:glycoside-pentoside-hexuronide (GPH):cation symporter [Mycoplasmatota bacterium zrk1]